MGTYNADKWKGLYFDRILCSCCMKNKLYLNENAAVLAAAPVLEIAFVVRETARI